LISILLIDDEAWEEDLLSHLCEKVFGGSFRLDYAALGSEAVKLLLENAYDLILLDNNLSHGFNAKFTTPILKEFSRNAIIAIISNNIHQDYLDDPGFLGVDHVLPKTHLDVFLRQLQKFRHRITVEPKSAILP